MFPSIGTKLMDNQIMVDNLNSNLSTIPLNDKSIEQGGLFLLDFSWYRESEFDLDNDAVEGNRLDQ